MVFYFSLFDFVHQQLQMYNILQINDGKNSKIINEGMISRLFVYEDLYSILY